MGLRSKVMQGSIYLVLREGLGMLISIGTVLLITRTIGPAQYGIFTAAYGLCLFLQSIGHLGVGIYLVRQEGEQTHRDYHQAFTLLFLAALTILIGSLLALPLLQAWIKIDGFTPVFRVMIFSSFLNIISQVPLAKLERNLEFKRVAWVELLGQMILFLTSLPLAMRGAGAWSPTLGLCAQQVQTIVLLCIASRYRPSFHWSSECLKPMLSYGFGASASAWVWYAKNLVNPLIVGRFGGEVAVGQIALAIRMLDVLSFVKHATYRISIAALAQMQDDRERLRRAVSEGMELQILALGPILVLASWIGPIAFPIIFGPEWSAAMTVFPFIAVAYLGNAAFNLHCSALYVLRRNWEVTAFHAAYVVLFAVSAIALVSHREWGLVGYGVAESIAVVTYLLAHLYVTKFVGSPDYQTAGLWWGAFVLALFSHQVGWWVSAVLVTVLILPHTQHKIAHYAKSLRESRAS